MLLAELVTTLSRHDGGPKISPGAPVSLVGPGDVVVGRAVHDSRSVEPGDLFCCIQGAAFDGHHYAAAAVASGASALLCERPLHLGVPELRTRSVRSAVGPVAAALAGDPSRHLAVVGVTGTNGKTTTTHLLAAVMEAAARPCGIIGTLSGARTTPEAPELQAELARLRDAGAAAVAMEVSSHALDQRRVDGTWFTVAAFTNLSQDHLDHHGDMAAYFAAKARLFEPERCGVAVLDTDDPHGRLLLDAATVPSVGYSLADAEDLELRVDGSTFAWRGVPTRVGLAGRFNVRNALAAATIAEALGVEALAVAAGLAAAGPVPGRFERIEAGQPFLVAVDYAHTPDGLAQLLEAGRELAPRGRLIVVFGAGGDRDHAKRPLMGEVVDRLADVAVLTSDNPRREDPAAIMAAVERGMEGDSELRVEPDRAAAVALAVDLARPGDVVLIAGKGHETTQISNGTATPFDDRDVTRDALDRLGYHEGRPVGGAA